MIESPRNVVVLAHDDVAHELGPVGSWLDSRGAKVHRVSRDSSINLPDADLLIVMGSPLSVARGHCAPAQQQEIDVVREWVAIDRPYLGICFGAQVLAKALGGEVERMGQTHRSYAPLDTEVDELKGRWALWHEDAIVAPSTSQVHSRVSHADVAFSQGRAWGLQVHIEFTADIVERLGERMNVPEEQWRPLADGLREDVTVGPSRVWSLLDHIWSSIAPD
ncbi:MAG: type 1 glutamine amidotransferase [Actinomycetota bacterium]